MIRIFTGFDQRESAGWHAFVQSLIDTSSEPFQVIPVSTDAQRDGSNAFTYARFLVPYYCGFDGYAVFVDGSDMIAQADFKELWALASGWHAVQVVKQEYRTHHPRKYVGTEMECDNVDYPRKNWSSAMIWNCSHYMNAVLTPEFVEKQTGAFLHGLQWLPDDRVGTLPAEWNWLVDEYGANTAAKLLHWTAGIPAIPEYRLAPHARTWFESASRAHERPRMAVKERVAA